MQSASVHPPSRVSCNAGSGKRGKYNWETAQSNATYHKRRKPGNRTVSPGIRKEAIRLLTSFQWSPEQISGSLKYRDMNISHETIYAIIRKDKREGGSLYMHCRHALKHRRRIIAGRCAAIPNRTSISLRPAEADGTRFGDFEMDTIVGKGNHGAIVTIVERSTNMFFMRKLDKGRNAQALAQTVVRMLLPYKGFIKSITTDNGTEFACHEIIARELDTKVYFADPYSSWQKGAVENQNGLARQYIPKGMTFDRLSHQKVTACMDLLNSRPRKKLNFLTPWECFYKNIT